MNSVPQLCITPLLLLLQLLALAHLLRAALVVEPSSGLQVDLVRVHESPKQVEFSGLAKESRLAPESEVVGVFFEDSPKTGDRAGEASLNVDLVLLAATANNSNNNKTKQSQDFDTHNSGEQQGTTTTTIGCSSIAAESGQTLAVASSSSSPPPPPPPPPTTTTTSTTTTTTTTETTTADDSQKPSQGLPVASKTTRQGAAVFCGEANPNGKSNKKLVLDRIVGGRKTEPGEFPFQVRLNIRSRRGSGICGGVVLDGRHILTAAHCMTACVSQYLTTATIESTGVHATIGDHSIKSNDGEIEVDIEKITPHEKYDACNFYANDHDIALIKTKQAIEYKFTTDGYGSINRPCMPNSQSLLYKDGESVIVSGWGVTRENSGSLSNILRYVQVPVVNITRCQETYGSRVTNDHVCAGYQSGGRDSCQGDSGGPLVRVLENRYELVGIVSFGYGCGQPGAPGVYTRVASYLDWIKANL